MKFTAVSDPAKRPKADLIIVPFFKKDKKATPAALPSDLKDEIRSVLEAGDFTGKAGATMLAYLSDKKEKRLLFLGSSVGFSSDPSPVLASTFAFSAEFLSNLQYL